MRSRLAILVTLVACADPRVEQLADIKAKVCACTTASCAEREIGLVPQTTTPSTSRTQALARDMLDCLAKLRDAERPDTDPDEPDAELGHDHATEAAAPIKEPRVGPAAPSPAPAATPATAPAAKQP